MSGKFQARGKADATRMLTMQEMLSYRDLYTAAPKGFNFDDKMSASSLTLGSALPLKLVQGENAFKRADKKTLTKEEQYRHNIQSLLNKLAADKFDLLKGEICSDEVLDPDNMSICVGLIFDKAIDEPFFVDLYVALVAALNTFEKERKGDTATKKSPNGDCTDKCDSCRRSLVAKAQYIFKKFTEEIDIHMLDEDIVSHETKRMENNLGFVAALIRHDLLSKKVFLAVCSTLLDNKLPLKDINIFITIRLLSCLGKAIDIPSKEITAKKTTQFKNPSEVFNAIEKIANDPRPPENVSKRTWFAAMDLRELRARKWMKKDELMAPAPATPTTPVSQGTPSSPLSAPPAYASASASSNSPNKKLREARPPSAFTEEIHHKLTGHLAAELTKDTPYWEGFLEEHTAAPAIPQASPSLSQQVVIYVFIKQYCTGSERYRETVDSVLPLSAKWPRQEVVHAALWTVCQGIALNESEDCPKYFKRLGSFLSRVFTDKTVATRDIIIHSSQLLGALAEEKEEKEEQEATESWWSLRFLELWGAFLEGLQTKNVAFAAEPVLDALVDRNNSFIGDIIADFVNMTVEHELTTSAEIEKWLRAHANAPAAANIVDELGVLFPF